MKLNSHVLTEIKNALDYSCFSNEDFILQNDNDHIASLTIKYRFHTNFSFKLDIYSSSSIKATFSPGSLLDIETIGIRDQEDIVSSIVDWLEAIEKDIGSSPILRKLKDKNSEFQEKLNKLEENINQFNLDSLFTRNESQDISERLDQLEEVFKQKLEEEQKTQETLYQEINKFSKEIDILKKQLDFLTKENWLKSFFTKTFNWGKRNPKTVLAIGKMAYDLLPEEVKTHIPEQLLELEVGDEAPGTDSLGVASGE
ncbi:hypothetical protein MHB54_22855 [Paenibacillus sp. FSL M7-0802]|uniref:hypothetical protein n=1 Tax=Paenibacillus TaxID=44249 RepID=UPI00222299B4|nr:hypothetical protein [Paenibacillus polymyxa]